MRRKSSERNVQLRPKLVQKQKKVHLETSREHKIRQKTESTDHNGSDSDQSEVEDVGGDGDEFFDELEAVEEDEQAMQVNSMPR
jgi:hypothetical protein